MRLAPIALAALIAALAACSGGEPPPAPEPAITAGAPSAGVAPEDEQGCLDGVTVASPAANPGLAADCSALLRARDALRGSAPLNWSAGRAIARWDGVRVGGNPPRVTSLNLIGRSLTGTIPPELGALTELTVLRLPGNRLSGPIPRELGLLAKLITLDLSRNRLTGRIPDLGGLSRLRLLDLRGNRLTTGIPRSLGRLPRLSVIRLSGNALTSCVPSSIADAPVVDADIPLCTPPRPGVRSALDVYLRARPGLERIEPVPGAFVHHTFKDGEAIDWEHGVFAHDVETGRTEGYAVAGLESDEHLYRVHPGGWITTWDGSRPVEWGLLLHVETGQSWRWPIPALSLEAASEEHLLFEERRGREPTGRFIITNRLMDEVARFSIDARGEEPEALFSPDGRAVLLELADKVYLVPVATGRPAVLFDPPLRDDGHETQSLLWLDADSRRRPPFGYPHWWYEGGLGIVVSALYETGADGTAWGHYYFSWEGDALPAPRCPGMLSPDGRYAAVQDSSHYRAKYAGTELLEHPWPSVTVTDAETCAPIFRVRSAHTYELRWRARWLPTSEGIVVGVRDGYAIARVAPEPVLTPLPDGWPGPDPAPTGDGRHFGYGSRVYDAAGDRWSGPDDAGGPFWWGASHRERWSHSSIYWGEGSYHWLLLPPKIEFPPFAGEIAFRVARTGSCLRLREEPGEESRVLDCLPDGARLLFVESDAEPKRDRYGYDFQTPHPSLSEMWRMGGPWVHVRTADGADGWVSHGYLEHD